MSKSEYLRRRLHDWARESVEKGTFGNEEEAVEIMASIALDILDFIGVTNEVFEKNALPLTLDFTQFRRDMINREGVKKLGDRFIERFWHCVDNEGEDKAIDWLLGLSVKWFWAVVDGAPRKKEEE